MGLIRQRALRGIGLVALLVLLSGAAHAEVVAVNDRVVAIVNDQVIAASDLKRRCQLAVATAGAPLSAAQQQGVCHRALARMIDSELQRQYAAQHKMEPTAAEVQKARQENAKNFSDVPASMLPTAEEQLRDELRWQTILAKAVRPDVQVGMGEVDKLIDGINKQRHVREREIGQILMNVPSPADEDKVKARMEDVQQRLAKGEDFAQLAKTLSDGREAKDGGVMGWFAAGELNPELESQLDQLKPGEVSGLIRSPLGWHIVKLLNVRASQALSTQPQLQGSYVVIAKEIQRDPAAEQQQQAALAKTAARLHSEAAARALLGSKDWPESADLGWLQTSDLKPDLQAAVAGLKPGQASKPAQAGGNDVTVYMIGTRTALPRGLQEYRERVLQHLFQQKMDIQARKFMRELRQKAFVDIREK